MNEQTNLSEHFSLAELTKTKTGIENVPSEAQVENLKRVCLSSGFILRCAPRGTGGAPRLGSARFYKGPRLIACHAPTSSLARAKTIRGTGTLIHAKELYQLTGPSSHLRKVFE